MANIYNLDDLTFFVMERSDNGSDLVEILAASMNFDIALAAYEKALEVRPNRYITLQQRSRVIRERPASQPMSPRQPSPS